MRTNAALFWSGGKDSAFTLYKVLYEGKYNVQYLITTINSNFGRVSMHGVREELITLQASSIGIPLRKMYVHEGTNAEYELKLMQVFTELKEVGIDTIIYGDIFLEDLRKYRDGILLRAGMTGVYPLWKKNTAEMIKEFLSLGFRTLTCCVNDIYLDESNVGIEITEEFISSLPKNVDPCGENGEFHTFCFAGPIFENEIKVKAGEKIFRPLEVKQENETIGKQTGFWYCDINPVRS